MRPCWLAWMRFARSSITTMIEACLRLLAASLAVSVMLAQPAIAKPARSKSAIAEFKRSFPCPANGQSRGACPGYVVDHIEPLCAGGADAPHNMQWQTVADAKAKDREERRQCRRAR